MNITDLTYTELENALTKTGYKRFRAQQIFQWIYKKHVFDFAEMTNISLRSRHELADTFTVETLSPPSIHTSSDGTRKLRFTTHDNSAVEAVIIPEGGRNTLCISTQIGCPLRCLFCRTGNLGFKRDLRVSEIVGQVLYASKILADEGSRITNIVYMGMGEPLLNYSATVGSISILRDDNACNFSNRRITVSTVGITEKIEQLGHDTGVNLALSLHAVDDETRNRIIPVNRQRPLKPLLEAVHSYPMHKRKKVVLEYIMLNSINDSKESAVKLAKIANRLDAKVNIIPFNSFPESTVRPTPLPAILRFQKILTDRHVTALIRKSRGDEQLAACGQLGHTE